MFKKLGSVAVDPKEGLKNEESVAQKREFQRSLEIVGIYKEETARVRDCRVPNRSDEINRDYNGPRRPYVNSGYSTFSII